MKLASKATIKLKRISASLYRPSAVWLTPVLVLTLFLAFAGVLLAQEPVGAPPEDPGDIENARPPACMVGSLVARPDIAGTTTSSAIELLPLANDMVAPPLSGPPDGGELGETSTITLTAVATPSNGSVVWGTVDVTTTVIYTPNAEFTGSDVFTYTITDECGRTAVGRINVIVFRDDMPAQPAIITRPPNPGQGVTQTLTLPVSATLAIPAEVFAETNEATDLHFFTVSDLGKPEERLAELPGPGQRFADVAFGISEFRNDGEVEHPVYQVPLILEIAFELAGQEAPQLLYWNTEFNEWRRDGIERVAYLPETGMATFAIYHLTDFALFAQSTPQQFLFLPTLAGGQNQ